jgi:hypothetical protein
MLRAGSDYCVTIKYELPTTFVSLRTDVAECSVLSGIIGRVHVIQLSCKSMNPINTRLVTTTIGQLHATTVQVHATIGRVLGMIG